MILCCVSSGFPVDCDSIFDTYTCDDGTCVLRSDRCDDLEDCPDGSDEGAENCGKCCDMFLPVTTAWLA